MTLLVAGISCLTRHTFSAKWWMAAVGFVVVVLPTSAVAAPRVDYTSDASVPSRLSDEVVLDLKAVPCVAPGVSVGGAARLTFRSGSTVRRFEGDPCSSTEMSKRFRGNGWLADMRIGGLFGVGLGPRAQLRIRIRNQQSVRRTFRYSIALGNRKVESGRVFFQVYRDPGRRIYEGEDEFVNYCINRNREIRSLDGRLYCFRPPSVDIDQRVVVD